MTKVRKDDLADALMCSWGRPLAMKDLRVISQTPKAVLVQFLDGGCFWPDYSGDAYAVLLLRSLSEVEDGYENVTKEEAIKRFKQDFGRES